MRSNAVLRRPINVAVLLLLLSNLGCATTAHYHATEPTKTKNLESNLSTIEPGTSIQLTTAEGVELDGKYIALENSNLLYLPTGKEVPTRIPIEAIEHLQADGPRRPSVFAIVVFSLAAAIGTVVALASSGELGF